MTWTKKEIGIASLISLIFFVVALIVLEMGLAILRPGPVQRDALLGWRMKENFQREFPQRTLGGQAYSASFATNALGLREFGTNSRAPVTILVLGDSFTADPYASNDRMWYARMAQTLAERTHRPVNDFRVLAGGAGGWGTYQNLLLSQTLAPQIRPSLFVLQFCSNDFQNNAYEWETQGVVRSQYMRRPFATSSGDGPKYVPGIAGAIYRSFIGESRLFNRIDGVIGGVQFQRYGGYIRPLPAGLAQKYERESVNLTKTLLTKLRAEYRGVPAVMVNCDGTQSGISSHWKTIARDAGFIALSRPSDVLGSLKPEQRKTVFNADGSHLSDEGNQLYGAIVGDEIAQLALVPAHK